MKDVVAGSKLLQRNLDLKDLLSSCTDGVPAKANEKSKYERKDILLENIELLK